MIEATAPLGARVLLIDTFSKSHGGLLDFFSLADLRKIITAAQAISWQVVLGGSLRGDSIERALEIEPDVVAVRGAACEESRTGSLSKERICRLVKMVREQTFRDRAVRNA